MLKALKKLGELRLKVLGMEAPPIYDHIEADYVLIIEFDAQGNYTGLSVEAYDEEKVPLYMYKKAKGSNPPSLTPTLYLTAKSVDNIIKSYKKLKKCVKNGGIPKLDFEKYKDRIGDDIRDKVKNFNKKYILTVRIDGKFIGEIDSFKDTLKNLSQQEGKSDWVDGICAICGRKTKVSGDISPFKFYTIDKPGYAIGFSKKHAYRSFPLCRECRELIRFGRQYVEKNLTFKFVGGIKYSIIPDFILGSENVREEVLDILTKGRKSLKSLKKENKRRITDDEDEILGILSEEKDIMSFHFLFMKVGNNEEKILLYIQDVYPSRLRKLFEVKDYIDKLLHYKSGKDFTYGTVGKFFKIQNSTDDFYEVIYRTFTGKSVDRKWVVSHLMGKIREDFLNSKYIRYTITDAFATFIFIMATTEKEGSMSLKDLPKEASSLEEFLDSLPALDTPLKKGLFLMGALTEKLLSVQAKERDGNKPFLKALKSLKMTERDLKGLLPKVRNKLEEYDRFGKGESILYTKASEYLAQAPPSWRMSVDELNFYFALGLGMFDRVAQFIYEKKEGEG